MTTAARLDAIHAILDDIAGLVGSPALVEDPQHVVIAYSEHSDPGDVVRAETILGKRASPEVACWLARMGIAEAAGPVTVPPNPALEMYPRICFPLRAHGQLLGYLWFIDEDMDMSPFDVERAMASATALTRWLLPHRSIGETLPSAVMRGLLAGHPSTSHHLERLADRRLETEGRYRVLAVRPTGARPSGALVRHLLRTMTRQFELGSPLASVVDDVGRLVLVETAGGPDPAEVAHRTGRGIAGDAVIGIGDPVDDLDDLPTADATALHAGACAAIWPSLGPVVDWPSAGLYRLVPPCALPDSPSAAVVDLLRELMGLPELEHLVTTVETYLDLAAHAQEAAAALNLHRATLYQRLQRFTEVTGLDVKDGEMRSFVHLAVKAARFAADAGRRGDSCRPLRRN